MCAVLTFCSRDSTPPVRRSSTFSSSLPPVEHPELPIHLIHMEGKYLNVKFSRAPFDDRLE